MTRLLDFQGSHHLWTPLSVSENSASPLPKLIWKPCPVEIIWYISADCHCRLRKYKTDCESLNNDWQGLKKVLFMFLKNKLFGFCLISLAHMGRWNEVSDVYQKSNWGGTGLFRQEEIFYWWSWSRRGMPHTASVSLGRFRGWAVSSGRRGGFQRTLLRFLSWSFLPQSGTVECRRMSCPPLNCSPDSLPVHIAGQCCKVCRRKC